MQLSDLAVFVGYAVFIIIGRIYDFFTRPDLGRRKGFAPLIQSFDGFYIRRVYGRVRDTFNHAISSRPDREIDVESRHYVDGNTYLEYEGTVRKCLNLSSYNYLGFASSPPIVTENVLNSVDDLGLAISAPLGAGGRHRVITELEKEVSAFVGCEDAMVVAQGFATNSLVIPALAPTRDVLIVSDSLNHASIVCGVRASRASIQVFMHNNLKDLERVLRSAVTRGMPRTHRPWARIIVAVEGVYSMEGEVCPLHVIALICRKYKAVLWLDEAHSIGAVGATGRGVSELCGVPPDLVAIKMGTFTKSFGSVGGYVAGKKEIIQVLRRRAAAFTEGECLPPPIAAQCLHSLRFIQTAEGRQRLTQLRENCQYFRSELLKRRHDVLGHPRSPVVPVITRAPGRGMGWNRLATSRGIAAVVVGYPAVPITEARVRFCLSASHTREDLSKALDIIDELGDYSSTRLYKVKHDEGSEFWEDDGAPKWPPQWISLKEQYGADIRV